MVGVRVAAELVGMMYPVILAFSLPRRLKQSLDLCVEIHGNRCCEVRHRSGSLGQHDERLAFFDDVRREFRRVAGADVLRCVNRSARDE